MKLLRAQLMDKLGVGRDLSPYETCPWVHYDEDEGINCSAEVRLEGDGQEAEAELQFVYDDPPEGTPTVEQICSITAKIKTDEKFEVVKLMIRREDKAESVYNWQEKSCNFFRACVREIKAGRIPDIDMLLERELSESGRVGDKWGDGSSKAPKINTATLMNDMKGKGM
jgi:hypothetical protein